MFDSVLQERKVAKQRALGGAVSFAVHAAIIGAVLWYGLRKPKAQEITHTVPVAFLSPHAAAAAPAAAAPPPPAPKPKHHKPKTKVVKKPLVIPKEVPKVTPPEKQPDPEPQPEDDSDDDDSDDTADTTGGVPGGVAGGVPGGKVGGSLGAGGDAPVFFGDGMTKPVLDTEESHGFRWTRAQLDARVSGLCLVQCIITRDGELQDCKILKRIPMVEDAQIMDYLHHLKFHPALQGGKPISLKGFTIPLRLRAE